MIFSRSLLPQIETTSIIWIFWSLIIWSVFLQCKILRWFIKKLKWIHPLFCKLKVLTHGGTLLLILQHRLVWSCVPKHQMNDHFQFLFSMTLFIALIWGRKSTNLKHAVQHVFYSELPSCQQYRGRQRWFLLKISLQTFALYYVHNVTDLEHCMPQSRLRPCQSFV